MERRLKLLVCIALCLAPLIYLAFVWQGLPERVPTHFNAAGVPDDYSDKSTLWAIGGLLAALTIGLFLLLNNLHRIDPKRYGGEPSPSFARLADGVVLLVSALNFAMLFASSGHPVAGTKMILPLVGLMFVFLGNVMYSLKPNYFAGIRLPWTLASDDNWKATHRVAGVIWFAGGLAFLVCTLTLDARFMERALWAVLIPMIAVPVAFSFWYFKRHSSNTPD